MRRIVAALAATIVATAAVMLIMLAPRPSATPPVPQPSASVTATPAPTSASVPETPEVTEPPAPVVEPVLAIESAIPMAFSDELDPPTYDGVFVLDDPAALYFADGSDTRFYLSHAMGRGWGAPGNLWNALEPGQVVLVEGERFTVTAKWSASKDAVDKQPVWALHDPNQVVLISCTPRGDGLIAASNTYVTLRKES